MAPLNTLEFVSYDEQASVLLTTGSEKLSLPLHAEMTPRKGVCFTAENDSCTTIHILDYSPEEKEATWYNRGEIALMRHNAKMDANLPEADTCMRGLEAKTPNGARRKLINRREARTAVFLEQEMQDDDGCCDPDAIADAYYEVSERCQVEAQMLALRDQNEAAEAQGLQKLVDIELPVNHVPVEMVVAVSAAA